MSPLARLSGMGMIAVACRSLPAAGDGGGGQASPWGVPR